MITPDIIEFAQKFGFPALVSLALLYGGYKLLLKPLLETHIDYVKESKGAITDVAEAVRDNLETSRAIRSAQEQHSVQLARIADGVGCKGKA